MIVRELERLLVDRGAGAAKIDAVTRRLREIGRLPKGGRGTNAPSIGPGEAAAILLALAGSTKGAEADGRLTKLEALRCTARQITLLEMLAALLEDQEASSKLREIRVGRTTRRANVIWEDGVVDEYRAKDARSKPDRFYVEGVLPGALLQIVATALKEDARPPRRPGARQS